MSTFSINDISTTADRFKLCTLMCNANELTDKIAFVKSQNINVINIGKELATYIDGLEDFSYLNIDVYDYTKKLLDKHKSKINSMGNDVLAIYNLGILMEPALKLNAVQLLKEFSKSASLIIIWDNQSDIPDRLIWPTQKNNFFLDFSESQLKNLQYAI
ncbi:MAG: hypothetical protein IPO21_19320 [Bacteroidales bacterium]|nr:hypothetical protein [Bacteroidales bacterium]